MAATYVDTLLLARDRLRFRLGDTDTANALLSDNEIAAAITLKTDEDAALLYLAKALLARWGRAPIKVTADGTTLDFSERVNVWREIVAEAGQSATGGLRIRRLARPQKIDGQGEYTT